MRAVVAFIRLGRPLFLGGGFLLFALGAAIAARFGHAIEWRRYALGQGVVTAFQLMTHYANDYFDYEADVANQTPTAWSGGSRVLAQAELPRRVALIAAIVLAAIGIAVAIVVSFAPFIAPSIVHVGAHSTVPHSLAPSIAPTSIATWHFDPAIAITCGVMLVLAWEYSAPPLRLCATGVGELDTAIVVTVLVPWLGFYLQAPDLVGLRMLAIAIVPLVLLQFAMLLAIEFPDAAGDAATGKRTLVVRLGARRSATLYRVVTAAAFLWLPIAFALGAPAVVVLAAAIPAPIAVWRIARIADHADPAAFERLTTAAAFLLVATTLAELVAFAAPLI